MEIAYYLLPLALSLGVLFLIIFLLAAKTGQFDDLDTPAHRVLIEEEKGETEDE